MRLNLCYNRVDKQKNLNEKRGGRKLRELKTDSFYQTLNEYDRTEVDYCLLENDSPDMGELSHKEAVVYAMRLLCEKYPWISFDAQKATADKSSAEKLLYFPDEPRKSENYGTKVLHLDFNSGGKIPYWYAFTEPPHGTGPVIRNGITLRNEYGREDFETINRALFPAGTDGLEVYEWSTDWSDYFDAGSEWWGTLCFSVYDNKLNRYAVIMASSTD